MKLSKTQSTLIRLMANEETAPGGVWYPHPEQYIEGKFVYINGSSIAMAIKALWAKGLGKPIEKLHPYASEITKKGREIVATEKGNPII